MCVDAGRGVARCVPRAWSLRCSENSAKARFSPRRVSVAHVGSFPRLGVTDSQPHRRPVVVSQQSLMRRSLQAGKTAVRERVVTIRDTAREQVGKQPGASRRGHHAMAPVAAVEIQS